MPKARFLAPLLLIATLGNSTCHSSGDMLRQMGYTELRPASTLLAPGTLVVIDSRDPFQARIICGAEASLGPDLPMLRSVTSGGSLKSLRNKSFTIDASILGQLKENETLRSVESVTATLKNAVIVELTDEAVLAGIQLRSRACAEAVRSRVEKGYTITMISSALVGDIAYQVSFDNSARHHAAFADKSMAMMDLAVALEGETSSSLSGEIYSRGLVLGIRDDEYLSALSIPDVDETAFDRNTRHIGPEHVVHLKPEAIHIEPAPAPKAIKAD